MMVTLAVTANLSALAQKANDLICLAASVGEYRRKDQWTEFEQTLANIGMGRDEIEVYWYAIVQYDSLSDMQAGLNLARAKNNTELCDALGVTIQHIRYPRNWLLYRLAELMFPEYYRVTIAGDAHMGGPDHEARKRVVFFRRQPCVVQDGRKNVVTVLTFLKNTSTQSMQYEVAHQD